MRLESVAKSLVTTGLYREEETAIRAMAVEQKIAAYREQMQTFEEKHHHYLDEHSRFLEGKASMEEEDEWMEWKGAAVMLEAWQRALQEALGSVLGENR